jgi:hypothetical protein
MIFPLLLRAVMFVLDTGFVLYISQRDSVSSVPVYRNYRFNYSLDCIASFHIFIIP